MVEADREHLSVATMTTAEFCAANVRNWQAHDLCGGRGKLAFASVRSCAYGKLHSKAPSACAPISSCSKRMAAPSASNRHDDRVSITGLAYLRIVFTSSAERGSTGSA